MGLAGHLPPPDFLVWVIVSRDRRRDPGRVSAGAGRKTSGYAG